MQSLIQGLLDVSFRKVVAPKILPAVYISSVAAASVLALMAFKIGPFGIIAAPVLFVAMVFMIRVQIEVALSILQIAKYTAEIARRGRPPGGTEGPSDKSAAPNEFG